MRRLLGPGVATVLVAAAGVLAAHAASAGAAPAAAACSGADGVTAVVDFAELGGGVTAGCDGNGGGRPASEVFRDAGYTLEGTNQPGMSGFVCKIQGKPADGDCAADDAFWSLWWSDGKSGRWVFSNQGVSALDVPDGGYVAFAWHQGSGQAQPPAVAPTPRQEPAPSDSPGGGSGGGNGGGGGGGGTGGSGDGGATSSTPSISLPTVTTEATSSAPQSARPDRPKKRRDRASASGSAASTGTTSSVPAAAEITEGPPPGDLASETGDDDSALPTWIGLGVAVLVLGAAGLVTVLRRRTG